MASGLWLPDGSNSNDEAAFQALSLGRQGMADDDPAKAEMPNCTTNTLVNGASALSWLWASDVWMGWRAHQYLGGYARGRVTGNPFGNGCPIAY